MKTLKSLLWGFSLSALFLVSCGNENEPTNPGGGGTLPTDRSQLVTSMSYYGESFYDFTYDSNNRLTYINGASEDMKFYYEFSYSPLRIVAGDYKDIFIQYDLKVNDDGYITYLKDNEGYVETFEYSDGYLVKAVGDGSTYLYTWENGNLIKIEAKWEYSSGNHVVYHIYKYSYTEKSTDNTGVYFPHVIDHNMFLFMGGFFGKTSAKIPVSVEYTHSESNSERTEKNDIGVEYDNKGRIIKEFYDDKLVRVYAYEGNKAVWPEN